MTSYIMWINAIFRRTAHLHYSLYFYLLLLITVRSFDLKSSSNRISSLSKFRSCCLTLHQTRIDKSPSPQDQLTSKVATIKSGQNVMKSGSGSEINQLIIVSLEDRNKTQKERLKLLKDIVTQKKGLLNHVHAATMLQRCARGRMDITEAIPLTSLAEILSKSSHRKLKSVEAAHAIYGLRLLDSETRDVMPFLSLLTTLVSNCDEPFKGQEIGNALYGLQKFPSHSPEVRKLLSVLEIKFKSPTIQLSPQEISNALYGNVELYHALACSKLNMICSILVLNYSCDQTNLLSLSMTALRL